MLLSELFNIHGRIGTDFPLQIQRGYSINKKREPTTTGGIRALGAAIAGVLVRSDLPGDDHVDEVGGRDGGLPARPQLLLVL